MATKNIILQMKLENAIVDLMVRAGADNIIVDSGSNETLATRLATIASQISALQEGSGSTSGTCLLYTSPSPRDRSLSRMPSSA